MKTLRTLFKQDKEAFVVPKGIQDVIENRCQVFGSIGKANING